MNTTVTIPNELLISYADRIGYQYQYELDEDGVQIEPTVEELEAAKLAFAKESLFNQLLQKLTDPRIREIKQTKINEANEEAQTFKDAVAAQVIIE